MAERLIALAWKACRRETVSEVRILLTPLKTTRSTSHTRGRFDLECFTPDGLYPVKGFVLMEGMRMESSLFRKQVRVKAPVGSSPTPSAAVPHTG